MKKILFLLLVVCGLAACDNGGDDTPKDITITGGSTNQTIYADQTSVNNGEGIKFSTTGAWRTEIEEVTRAVSWIELSQTSGDKAGDYTLQITLGQNTTGDDRKATIKIICGDTIITITVEQKGTTEDGNIPEEPDPVPGKYITRIDVEDDYINDLSGTEYTTFRYDEDMLAEMIITETESHKGVLQHTWVTTISIDEISGSETPSIAYTIEERKDQGDKRLLVDAVAQIEKGRVTSCSQSGTDYDKVESGEAWSDFFKLNYDANGYLVLTERVDGTTDNFAMTWSEGNYTKVVWSEGRGVDEATYANLTYKNKANLDLNAYIVLDSEGFDFSFGEPWKILALCGYTGKRSMNLATKVNETLVGSTRQPKTYSYEFDTDGYPIKIRAHSTSSNSETTYKITYNR